MDQLRIMSVKCSLYLNILLFKSTLEFLAQLPISIVTSMAKLLEAYSSLQPRNLLDESLYILLPCSCSGLEIIIRMVPHISVITIGRFFSGLLSGIPTNVVAGSIEDIYGPKKRVWMIFASGVAANVGLTIGPIYNTDMTETISWYGYVPYSSGILLMNRRRWVFWIATIVEFAQAILTAFLKETQTSQILKSRLHGLNKATKSKTPFTIGNPTNIFPQYDFITNSLTRPTRLSFTESIVLLVTVMCAVDFGQIPLD